MEPGVRLGPIRLLLLLLLLQPLIAHRARGAPPPPSKFFVAIDRLEGLVNGNRFVPARALFDSLLSVPSPHPDVHRVLAIYFLRAGRPAQVAWDSVAALRPHDPGIAAGRAMSAVFAGDREKAAARFADAVVAFRRDEGALRFIELWRGTALANSGDLAGARHAFARLAAAAERARDLRVASRALSQEAEAAMRAGDYTEAEKLAERAVNLGRTSDTARLLGRSLRTRGRLKQLRGDLSGARRDFEAALAAAELDPAARIQTLKAIAGLETDSARYAVAFDRLNQALDLADEMRIPSLSAELYAELGLVEYRLGELTLALGYYQRALAAGKPRANLYNRIGVIHAHQGRYEEALADYERGLELARSAGDRREEASLLGHLGRLHDRLGDRERAEIHYRAAVAGFSSLGLDTEAAFHRHNLAGVAWHRGEIERATALLDTALTDFAAAGEERGRARSLVLLAQCRAAGGHNPGRLNEASALLDTAYALARSIGDAIGMAEAAESKGSLLLVDSPEKAEAHFAEVRERALEMGDPVLEAQAEIGLARANAHSGRGESAAAHYERALARAEAVRLSVADDEDAATFLAQTQGIYHELAMLYVSGSRRAGGAAGRALIGSAFGALERGRARSLLDRLARDGRGERGDEEARRSRELAETRLQALSARDAGERRRAWSRHDSLASLIDERERAASPQRFARRRPEPLGADQAERALARGQVLVAYSLAPDQSLAIILDRKGRRAVDLPGESKLDREVSALLDQIRHPDPLGAAGQPELARLIHGLYADLIAPLGLSSIQRLLILPDGVLHHLPFEVLADEKATVIERFEVAYAPSASTWEKLRERRSLARPRRAQERALALADPLPSRDLPALGGTRLETEAIAGALGRDRVDLRRGEEAAERILKSGHLSDYDVVHLAAHAVADDRRPEDCALELAPGGGDDGRLTADEAYDLDLDGQLVVLSGCETALGRDVRGEGIFGLGRAFLRAGARAVVASLWPVPDRASAELMTRFYRALATGETPAAALRTAKVAAVAGERHPFQWAGFVLIGD